ncbi:MAG: hypothetical protein ACLP4V_00835 [Methylocella sp.]
MKEKQYHPWERVLENSETNIKNVYSATFFARRNISIVDQQIRSFNLCYGLSESRQLKKSSHVAIVGCGVSGMTCAVALAVLADCMVYVFERETTLLRKFREAGFRYIHPDLNPRGGRGDEFPYEPHKTTNFAFMNWSGNYAPLVAEELVQKFEHYRRSTNIALHLGEEVIAIRSSGKKVEIELKNKGSLTFNYVIIASGFGNERRDENTDDDSYWHSGNPRRYRPSAFRKIEDTKERILISGNGDSGVIELAHYLIRDFSHKQVFSLLPTDTFVDSEYAELGVVAEPSPVFNFKYGSYASASFNSLLLGLRYREIEAGNTDYPGFSGPISWYLNEREKLSRVPGIQDREGQFSVERAEKAIYDLLHSHLASLDPRKEIPSSTIALIEPEVNRMLDDLASHEIDDILNKFYSRRIETIYGCVADELFKDSFRITVVGHTPLIYSRRQAPLNWFLLRALKQYGTFDYRRGKLTGVALKDGSMCATLELTDGTNISEEFDRIVVRHGPDFDAFGYEEKGIKPKKLHSEHMPMPIIGWRGFAEEKEFFAFIEYFRTPRWEQALRAEEFHHDWCYIQMKRLQEEIMASARLWFAGFDMASAFVSAPDLELSAPDHLLESVPDHLLLTWCLLGRQVEGSKMYRQLKSTKNVNDKRDALIRMLSKTRKLSKPAFP